MKNQKSIFGILILLTQLNFSSYSQVSKQEIKTVQIGTQVWTTNNLDVSTYRNGDPIPEVKDPKEWNNLTSGAWCYYADTTKYIIDLILSEIKSFSHTNLIFYDFSELDSSIIELIENVEKTNRRKAKPIIINGRNLVFYKDSVCTIKFSDLHLGKLYNWYAVNDPRGLAPEGFHIPTDQEWITLKEYLGGTEVAGKKMKSTFGWPFDKHVNNESGFNGLPGGSLQSFRDGGFVSIGTSGTWWSTTDRGKKTAWTYTLSKDLSNFFRFDGLLKKDGLSVRCIKD